jgi:hypothetical protein
MDIARLSYFYWLEEVVLKLIMLVFPFLILQLIVHTAYAFLRTHLLTHVRLVTDVIIYGYTGVFSDLILQIFFILNNY